MTNHGKENDMTTAPSTTSPEFQAWVELMAPRILAKLNPQPDWTLEDLQRAVGDDIIKEAHDELQGFIMEMAAGETKRSKLARTAIAQSVYDSLT